MDTLEAFERHRALPKESIPVVSGPLKEPIFRIKVDPDLPCNWQHFGRASIFFLDDDIVLKLQRQHPVAQLDLPSDDILLLLSLTGFSTSDLANETLARLKDSPCPNLAVEFDMGREGLSFSERLTPVTAVWAAATKNRRRRWAVEMTSAFAHLESLGLVPSHIAVQDLGIDRTGRLKLISFANCPRRPSNTTEDDEQELDRYRRDMDRAHQRLACCLYYLLSGIDTDNGVVASMTSSADDLRTLRETVRRGEYQLDPEASAVSEIIQAAWMKRSGTTTTFAQTAKAVRGVLDGLGMEQESELPPVLTEAYYQSLDARCREWANAQVLDPDWMGRAEYEVECEKVGYYSV
ncbi:putative kinase [Chaetomidium leptoderma]|uniref:Kinase n=1 Tax=Chaetomidium leptoderma TaxID=669021 RepID=A0AAN6VI14_9PEZI|nr:putative kinase [Chaetomidium leptoderma]